MSLLSDPLITDSQTVVLYLIAFSLLENDEEQLLEARKRLQEQISSLVIRLTKALRICKRKVDTMSPKVFRPSVSKLREAVDRALYDAERLKRVAISTTFALRRMIQRAAAVSDGMYIPSYKQTSASSCSLLRVQNLLKMAMRTASLVQAYTEKMAYGDFRPLDKQKVIESLDDAKSVPNEGNDCVMEATEPPKEERNQDEEMAEETR